MNLKEYYGCYIDTSVARSKYGIAWNSSMRILFDKKGSPHYHYISDTTSESGYTYLMKDGDDFLIRVFCGDGQSNYICIRPITGFISQVNDPSEC